MEERITQRNKKLAGIKRKIREWRDMNEKWAITGWASSRIVHIIFNP